MIALAKLVNDSQGSTIVAPQLAGFTLLNVQSGFDAFVTTFNATFPTHTIANVTVASTAKTDVQTAIDSLTSEINTALTTSLTSPVIGTFDISMLQSACNGLAREVNKVVAPIVTVLTGLNSGTTSSSTAVRDALQDHQAVLGIFNTLFDVAPDPTPNDAMREQLLAQVQSLF